MAKLVNEEYLTKVIASEDTGIIGLHPEVLFYWAICIFLGASIGASIHKETLTYSITGVVLALLCGVFGIYRYGIKAGINRAEKKMDHALRQLADSLESADVRAHLEYAATDLSEAIEAKKVDAAGIVSDPNITDEHKGFLVMEYPIMAEREEFVQKCLRGFWIWHNFYRVLGKEVHDSYEDYLCEDEE